MKTSKASTNHVIRNLQRNNTNTNTQETYDPAGTKLTLTSIEQFTRQAKTWLTSNTKLNNNTINTADYEAVYTHFRYIAGIDTTHQGPERYWEGAYPTIKEEEDTAFREYHQYWEDVEHGRGDPLAAFTLGRINETLPEILSRNNYTVETLDTYTSIVLNYCEALGRQRRNNTPWDNQDLAIQRLCVINIANTWIDHPEHERATR